MSLLKNVGFYRMLRQQLGGGPIRSLLVMALIPVGKKAWSRYQNRRSPSSSSQEFERSTRRAA